MSNITNEQKAQSYYEKILLAFSENNPDSKCRIKSETVLGTPYNNELHGEKYGGAFYDLEKEKLTICMVNETDYNYCDDILGSAEVIYKQVKYSLNILLRHMHILNSMLIEFNMCIYITTGQ